jgi:cytochrome c556
MSLPRVVLGKLVCGGLITRRKMMRLCLLIGMVAIMAASVSYLGSATAADDDVKDVKGCMAFQNNTLPDLKEMLKAKEPQWEEIQKTTKAWVKVSESIGGFKPPRGDEKSWKEQTTKYVTNVAAVDKAAGKKDTEEVKKGLATVGASCGGCHSKHKPLKK